MKELDGYYWINTGWAMGTVKVKNGKVCEAPKHFKKFIGKDILSLERSYTVERD